MPLPSHTTVREVDLPNLPECFVDTVGLGTLHGSTLRLMLCTYRFEEPHPPNPQVVTKVPACRLVLTAEAAIELYNMMNSMMGVMQQAGLIKVEPGKPPAPASTTH